VKRWESIPDRRNPYTIEIQTELDNQLASDASLSEDGLTAALSDWFAMGLSDGHRLSEWAQHDSNKGVPTNPARNENGAVQAFCPDDVVFFAAGKKRLSFA